MQPIKITYYLPQKVIALSIKDKKLNRYDMLCGSLTNMFEDVHIIDINKVLFNE